MAPVTFAQAGATTPFAEFLCYDLSRVPNTSYYYLPQVVPDNTLDLFHCLLNGSEQEVLNLAKLIYNGF